ncbi:MAG: DNA polymerase III subunit beta [Candidatus Methylacidiphilales bacterium]|nr:DNA polymerase III subunit beta [Candidatus Methylacidiphilales bacterium]
MKVILTKDALVAALSVVQNVVSTRSPLPILGNALVKAADGKLTIATTDLAIGIRAVIPAEVIEAGATTLPAKRFFSIIRELPAPEITLTVDDKHSATIESGSAFYKIMGMPQEEFPPFPRMDGTRSFTLKQAELKDMLRRTSYAISTEESRYVLNGVLLSFKENQLTVVATDGRRLAMVQEPLEFPEESSIDIILPTAAVNELQRVLKGDEPVGISIGQNQIAFDLGHIYMFSKLVDGNYPEYKRVIPPAATDRIILERELLLSAVKRVALLANEKSMSVKLAFGNNMLEISANTPDIGEAKESLPINYNGRAFAIAFNPEYLMDPLKNLDGDQVFFDFTNEYEPGVLKYNRPFTYVIMPMRATPSGAK